MSKIKHTSLLIAEFHWCSSEPQTTKIDGLNVIWTKHPVSGHMIDAPEDLSRKVEDDTVILSNVQPGSSAVYQCNASNEFGYLMANAFVNVLGK